MGWLDYQDTEEAAAVAAQEETDHDGHVSDCAPCRELDIQRERTARGYVRVDIARRALARGIQEALKDLDGRPLPWPAATWAAHTRLEKALKDAQAAMAA
jgi:phosphoglycolate phosphatase-like HAD superfamily hydrolase